MFGAKQKRVYAWSEMRLKLSRRCETHFTIVLCCWGFSHGLPSLKRYLGMDAPASSKVVCARNSAKVTV